MSGKSPLTDSISRIERDAKHQSKIDAHRDHRIEKTQEHRDKVNAHLDKTEARRTKALERVHSARQEAYERAGIADSPAIVSSEARLQKHLDKAEQRRAEALQHVHERRAKAEEKLDRRVAKIESRGHEARESHTNERELRHFDREHRKEQQVGGHVESAKELQLRLARESKQRESRGDESDDEMVDDATPPTPKVGVFTVKTSSED